MKGLNIMADTFVIAPKLRKLFFRGAENTGLSIENAVHFPTDAQIVAVLGECGLRNKSGAGSPITGEVVPAYIGQHYTDTGGKLYFAKGLTFNDWVELANQGA